MTVIKTTVITIVETTLINAMTSTTIYHTVPITISPAPTTTTITLPCTLPTVTVTDLAFVPSPEVDLPALEAEKEPFIVEAPLEDAAPVIAEAFLKDPNLALEDAAPVIAEASPKDPKLALEDAAPVIAGTFLKDPKLALEDSASPEQITNLQNNVDELMNTFNELLSQIEMTVEGVTLANRMRKAAIKVTMQRSSAVQVEFVRNFKAVLSQAAVLKANPKVFFKSVEELVDKMEKYNY